jgi:hypothetical protein
LLESLRTAPENVILRGCVAVDEEDAGYKKINELLAGNKRKEMVKVYNYSHR